MPPQGLSSYQPMKGVAEVQLVLPELQRRPPIDELVHEPELCMIPQGLLLDVLCRILHFDF